MLDLKILCHPLPGKDYVTSGVGEAISEFTEWDCVKGRGHNEASLSYRQSSNVRVGGTASLFSFSPGSECWLTR